MTSLPNQSQNQTQNYLIETKCPQSVEELRFMLFDTLGRVDFSNVTVKDLSYAHAQMANIYLDSLCSNKQKVQELKELCAIVKKQYPTNERLIDFLLKPILKQCVF